MKKLYSLIKMNRMPSILMMGILMFSLFSASNAYGQTVIAINCGSDTDYTAVDGQLYVADVYGTGGSSGNSFTGPKYTGDILNTEDDVLYQTYYKTGYIEGDDFFYNIPLDDGTYHVTLKFADYQQWQRNAGHVIIEGTQLLTSFVVQEVAGDPFVAFDTTFTVILEDGELNIQFINDDASVGDFFLNGLLIKEDVPYSLGINCGGDTDYTAVDGKVYVADVYGTGGSSGNSFTGPKYTGDILNTEDDVLYQTYYKTGYIEGDDFFYNIPLDEGTYEITLKFADYQQWQRNAGHVIIEGTQLLTSFVVQEVAGDPFVALDTTFTIKVEDGELNIQFINDDASVGDFFLNGIFIQELTEIYYSLETTAENGTITLDPVGGSYTSGTEVTATVEPDYGYQFVEWTGDLEGIEDATATTITVLMDKAKSITATFEALPMYTLTTNIENGIVYLDPEPDSSGNRYYGGAEVNLIVTPYVGYQFVEWTGDLSGSETPVKIVMDADKDITAVIEAIPSYSITVTPPTNGSVQLLPNKESYAPNEAVVIAAKADAGYRFKEWGGSLAGRDNPTSVVMNEDLTVSVTFELIPASYTLTVEATNGSVTLDPDGGTYEDGTVVTVTAVPDADYEFGAWGGDASGTENPMTITMDADKNVSASFTSVGISNTVYDQAAGLMQNYPNPFSVATTIPYRLDEAANVNLSIYNALGQKVITLVDDHQSAGNYTIDWKANDGSGSQLSNGLYLIRLKIGADVVQIRKSTLIR